MANELFMYRTPKVIIQLNWPIYILIESKRYSFILGGFILPQTFEWQYITIYKIDDSNKNYY